MRFTDRIAIVTGAASGIGRAIALRLAREGARVLLADRDAAGKEMEEQLRSDQLIGRFMETDVSSESGCRGMVESVLKDWGRLDILVNSAGIGRSASLEEQTEEVWNTVLDINLTGVFLSCKAAFPALRETHGSIINLASLAGIKAWREFGAYAASKAGVIQLTRVLALEGAPFGVRVNALCPIWIDTPMVQRYVSRTPDPEATMASLARSVPLGRVGTPDDVAATALFLLSDEASFLTGLALPIDGGASCV